MPITEVEKIWMDGELVDWADANVHVLSPRGALRQRGLRGDPGVRDRSRPGGLAPRRAPEAPVPLGEAVPHGDPVLDRGDHRGDEGRDPRQRAGRVLRPPAGAPRVRRDGREPAERPGQRVHRGLALGRLPGRGRARAGRAHQDLSLAAELPERAAVRGEGHRPVHQRRARQGREPQGRVRRGHHAERAGVHHRRLGGERVHRARRQCSPRRRSRPGAWTASRAGP